MNYKNRTKKRKKNNCIGVWRHNDAENWSLDYYVTLNQIYRWIITSHCIKYVVGLLRHTAWNISLDYYVTLNQIFRSIITSHCIKYVVGLLRHTESNMSLDYYVTLHQICRWIITSHYTISHQCSAILHSCNRVEMSKYWLPWQCLYFVTNKETRILNPRQFVLYFCRQLYFVFL